MATSIYFDGRTTSIPGAYTTIDASGLDAVGVGATGIVALIGTAEGGQPVIDGNNVEMTTSELIRLTNPAAVLNTFKSGDLREAGSIAFSPSTDPAIPGGAQQLICLKVNKAKPSTATLSDTLGGTALTLTSRDYGAFTEQLQVDVATSASAGLNVTITNNATASTETYLNLGEVTSGSTDMFTLRYDPPAAGAAGWNTTTAETLATGVKVNGGLSALSGLDGAVTPQAQGTIEAVSSDAGDTQTIIVYGLDASGNAITETITLNGTSAAQAASPQTFGAGDVLGMSASANTTGTVTIRLSGGGATILVSVGGTSVDAAVQKRSMFVGNAKLSLVADGATTKDVLLYGLSASGGAQIEKVTLTGAVAKETTNTWSRIDTIVLGDLEAGKAVTITGTAAQTTSAQATLQQVNDYFNARRVAGVASAAYGYSGFTFTLSTTQTTLSPTLLDVTSASPGAQSIQITPLGFSAILNAVVSTLNANSPTVKATRGTTGLPPVVVNTFLSGGEEGSASSAEYTAALELLKSIDVSTIVPLTGDPAIHKLVNDHCVYMAGQGKSERDGVVGLVHLTGSSPTVPYAPPTKTQIKDQAIALNSRHLRACGQSVSMFNTAGTLTVFPSYYQAVLVAAMQAGSPVGTSLTRKTMNAVSISEDSTWSPMNDSNELIGYGLWFAESHRTGIRCVRNITTYLTSNNVAFVEASVNEAANFAVFNFRNELEKLVGKKGFSGTVNAGRIGAAQILDLLVEQGTLVQWRSLQLELNVDTLAVSVEIAPVIPINFVTATVHLVTLPISG
jgi:hypothetical protein